MDNIINFDAKEYAELMNKMYIEYGISEVINKEKHFPKPLKAFQIETKEMQNWSDNSKYQLILHMYNKKAKQIFPSLQKSLQSYKFEKSPINKGEIDRETLSQIVDASFENYKKCNRKENRDEELIKTIIHLMALIEINSIFLQ